MILMISRKERLREYVLPLSDGVDYQITLKKHKYNLANDIRLELENTEGKWFIKESDDYSIENVNPGYGRLLLNNEDTICFVTAANEKFRGIAIANEKKFLSFQKYDISRINKISIGNSKDKNISYSFMKYVSQNQAVIVRKNDGWYIEDTSVNGTFVKGYKISGSRKLEFGDEINAFGLRMVFLEDVLAVGSHYGNLEVKGLEKKVFPEINTDYKSKKKPERKYYHRSPRNIPKIYTEKLSIENAPEARISKRRSLLAQIGPSMTMAIPMMLGCLMSVYASRARGGSAGTFMYTGIVTALGSALIGAVWAILNIRREREDELSNETVRFNEYGSYLISISDELKEKYSNNRNAMFQMYPAPCENCRKTADSIDLWNRNMTHDDFMYYRIGVGNIPFQVTVEIPKERFSMSSDFLRDKVKTMAKNYETLENVPICVDLFRNYLFGVVGGEGKKGAVELMYSIVSGIASSNCYTDVKMVFIYGEDETENWDFVKWFPHVWSENRKTRYVASNENEAADVLYELLNIMRFRDEKKRETGKDKTIPKPHYVVFVSDPKLLDNKMIAKYIYNPSKDYGMTTLIMSEHYEDLPNECTFILENTAEFQGYYNTHEVSEKKSIKFDKVTYNEISALARSLSDIQVQEIESDTEIPSVLDFFEMYGVDSMEKLNVLEQWYKNRNYNSMKALIGKKAGGADCYLDIHEKFHGPHGLVAGTTGSGKSEILQTYILSLAINFSPDDIAFFIIDFKGGGMSNLFTNLPHMAGEISNLSGNQVRRAMISIKSENRRRQRIFSEYGVNNINLYTRLYKSHEAKIPIPHLIIVIDEFAELKREEPEFMKELISVAQVGRSLGVHLILATQKPNGTVDDNIRSNSKFHLCLRVQDRQDSNDMLHKPDAAYITQAGRCYIQVGNDEVFDLFQSGWSGAVYDKNMSDKNAEIATMITLTGKPAIYGSRNKMKRLENEKISWYGKIISIIDYVKNESYPDKSITELTAQECTEISDAVYRILCSQEDYEASSNNQNSVKNFVKLYSSGAVTTAESVVRNTFSGVKLPEIKEKTQLEVLVKYIRSIADNNGFNYQLHLWLPVLPELMAYSELVKDAPKRYTDGDYQPLNEKEFSLKAYVGMYDDPENQLQLPVSVDFATDGNLALCAAISTGKSTFMQTLIYSLVNNYTPDELNLYILDYSSHRLNCYESLPHVGGVINENDSDKAAKFFMMMTRMIAARQEMLNGGSYSECVRAYGRKMPAVLIVIDNFGTFKEKTAGEYEQILMQISRDGQSVGIFLAISSGGFGMSEISGRMAENMKNVICLEMGDKFKYMDVMRQSRISVLPEAGVKGRGLVKCNDRILEFQTVVAAVGEDDYERSEKLIAFSKNLAENWKGATAAKIPCIPEKPVLSDLKTVENFDKFNADKRYLPIGYTAFDASLECIDLSATFLYTFAGRKRTGKTNAMKIAIEMAAQKDGDIIIIEKEKNELSALATQYGARYIDSCEGVYRFFADIKDTFVARNKQKRKLMENSIDDYELYEKMTEFRPMFIFISALDEFMEMIYKPDEGVGSMKGFVENIMDKGDQHNVFFFACMDPEKHKNLLGYNAYKSYIERKQGMHFGGCLDRQSQFTAVNISYTEQGKTMPKGVALTPSLDDDTRMYKVIVPIVGG